MTIKSKLILVFLVFAAFFTLVGTLFAQVPPPNLYPTKPFLNGTELLQIDVDHGVVPTSPLYLSTLQVASLASNATIPWPAVGTVVISSGIGNPPGGLQPINGNCLVGNSTPAWTVAPCPGGGGVTFPSAGSLVVSTGPSSTPNGLAPVNNDTIVGSGGAWVALASAPNSIYCTNSASIPSLCNSSTIQNLLGYITGNQPISLIGDTTAGAGTTTLTTVTSKVNAVAYPANPPTNTVPVVTAANTVSYDNATQLSGVTGFGTMLTQNASNVAITGGTISGVTISGLSLSSLGNIPNNTILCNNSGSLAPPIACTVAQIDTLLSLGSMANQSASNVAITGGTITGTTINGASNTLSNIGLSSLSPLAANTIVCNNTASVASPIACTSSQIDTLLGLGTMAFQAANSVAITGGTISGATVSGLSLASLGNIGANTIVCNNTASPAVPIACTVAQINTLLSLGSMANQAANNVTISGGTITGTTISGASNTLSNIALSSLAGIAANTIVCNNTGSTASPIACTPSQVSTLLGLGTMSTQNANSVAITGGTITGLPTPSNAADAATKSYVDASAGGQPPHNPVNVISTSALPNSPTYSNGTSGVGATLTAGANAALVIDGVTVSTTGAGAGTTASRVLVDGQATAAQNGIYTLTTAGSGAVAWVLTRATDFNTAASGNIATGATVLVTAGTVNANTSWSLSTTGAITVGTTGLTFVQVAASNSYTADNSTLQLVGSQFSEKTNGTTNTQLAQMAANTVKANFTAALANASDFAMPGCTDTGGNHLNYVMGTGITCGTSTVAGNVTTGDSSSTVGNVVTEAGTTGKTITQGPPIGTTGNSTVLETNASGQMLAPVNTTTGAFSGQITSTLASGTAPFVVSSNTNVPNLNASSLNGATFASPGPVGSTTPGSGAFTTLSASGTLTTNITGSTQCVHANSAGVLSGTGTDCASGTGNVTTSDSTSTAGNIVTEAGTTGKAITQGPPVGTTGNSTVLETDSTGNEKAPVNTTTVTVSGQITSTVVSGTAPLVVASNTNVPNLNASSLNGATFANPGPIGSTTPSSVASTTLSATGNLTTNITGSTQCVHANSSGVLSGTGVDCGSGSGAVSVTSTTPNIVINPSPGTGTFTISSAGPFNNQSSAGYTVVTGDNTKTVEVGAFTYTLPQAGSTGFASQWQVCFLMTATSGQATINTTTSLFTGASGTSSLVLNPGDWACPTSDGSNYFTLAGHYITNGVVSTGTLTATGATVSAAVNNGSGLIRLTVNQNIPTGTVCVVSSVGGVPEASGQFTATNISSTQIDLQGSSFGAGDTYTSGGVVSTQALAAQLTATWTRVTGGSGGGVKLPSAIAGASPGKVKNATGSDGLVVWPASGAAINALSANNPVIENSNTTGEFWATSTTQWDTQP